MITKTTVSYKTYKRFAKKYGIVLSYINTNDKRELKTMKKLRREIYNYEFKNNISNGLYF